MTLGAGATLLVVTDATRLAPRRLLEALVRHKVCFTLTFVWAVLNKTGGTSRAVNLPTQLHVYFLS